jgi:glycosyltransferase involved in cell wall biosynthesis
MPAEGGALRILGWPSLATPNNQPYIEQLYRPMAAKGVVVEELTRRRALLGPARLLHAHWPDSLLHQQDERLVRRSLARLRLLLIALRLRGIKLLWTAHNLHSHERLHPELEEQLWTRWTAAVDGFVSLSETGVAAVRDRFPSLAAKPAFVIPHGHYRDVVAPAPSRGEARARLGIPPGGPVLLFFGQVRAYKNLPRLVAAFRALDRADGRLLIAGKPSSPELESELRAAAGEDPRIRLLLRFVEEREASELFAAADLTALPFRDILNSGSALYSLSLDRPVLVPDKGAMAELAATVGERWVRLFRGELDAATLGSALEAAAGLAEGERPELGAFDWDPLVERTIAAYRSLVAEPRR